MGLYAAFWVAPVAHGWFKFLSAAVPLKQPILPRLATIVAVDQALMSPVFISAFFTTRGIIDYQSTDQITDKIQNETFDVWRAGCAFWVPVAFFNFYWVPFKYRVITANGFSFIWNTYLVARTKYEETPHMKEGLDIEPSAD